MIPSVKRSRDNFSRFAGGQRYGDNIENADIGAGISVAYVFIGVNPSSLVRHVEFAVPKLVQKLQLFGVSLGRGKVERPSLTKESDAGQRGKDAHLWLCFLRRCRLLLLVLFLSTKRVRAVGLNNDKNRAWPNLAAKKISHEMLQNYIWVIWVEKFDKLTRHHIVWHLQTQPRFSF